MQTMSVSLYKETTHLNLHRPYLSQALKDMPEDPLRHKYGASVMVIYRSAWRIINSVEQAYKAAPGIMSRMSLQWSQSLACAVVSATKSRSRLSRVMRVRQWSRTSSSTVRLCPAGQLRRTQTHNWPKPRNT